MLPAGYSAVKTKFSEKTIKERKEKAECGRLRYSWENCEERFGDSYVSCGWDLCILSHKKVAEGAVSLDPY